MTAKSKKPEGRSHRSAAHRKGRLAEQIAAWLHAEAGVDVKSNVRLPSLHQNRHREIDVLLTSNVAGYSVRMAIE